jgi:hypothetical protein
MCTSRVFEMTGPMMLNMEAKSMQVEGIFQNRDSPSVPVVHKSKQRRQEHLCSCATEHESSTRLFFHVSLKNEKADEARFSGSFLIHRKRFDGLAWDRRAERS